MAVNHTVGQIERGAGWDQVSRRVNVGAAWTLVAKANSNRRWLLAQNIADEYIELLFADSTPSSGQDGLRLGILDAANRYGPGTLREYSEVLGNLDRRGLYARCASGGKALVVIECPRAAAEDAAEVPAGYSSSSSSSSSTSSSTTSSSSLGLSSSSSSSSSSTSTSTSTSSQGLSSSSSQGLSSSSSTSTSTSSSSWSSVSGSSSSSSGP